MCLDILGFSYPHMEFDIGAAFGLMVGTLYALWERAELRKIAQNYSCEKLKLG